MKLVRKGQDVNEHFCGNLVSYRAVTKSEQQKIQWIAGSEKKRTAFQVGKWINWMNAECNLFSCLHGWGNRRRFVRLQAAEDPNVEVRLLHAVIALGEELTFAKPPPDCTSPNPLNSVVIY